MSLRTHSEDDIDDLLDQVEKQYIAPRKNVTTPVKPTTKSYPVEPKKCECISKGPTDWEEVEELLKDFKFEDTNPFAKQNNRSWIRQPLPNDDEDPAEVKCFPVYIAGSYEKMGLSTMGSERPCDRLKCVKCDFDVLALDNYVWDPHTDYLFLRNNMPEFEKLISRLSKRTGSRAYACQCQHVNVSKLTNLNSLPQLRWICKKHSSANEANLTTTSTKYVRQF